MDGEVKRVKCSFNQKLFANLLQSQEEIQLYVLSKYIF